jgi:hypothetical protein
MDAPQVLWHGLELAGDIEAQSDDEPDGSGP